MKKRNWVKPKKVVYFRLEKEVLKYLEKLSCQKYQSVARVTEELVTNYINELLKKEQL